MQTKHLLIFVAPAVLVGDVVSITTSGVLAAQTTSNSNNTTNTASTDSNFVREGLIDDDEVELLTIE